MNISEVIQVFVLIYVFVMGALYLTSRFWSPWLTKLKASLGFAAPVQPAEPADIPGEVAVATSYSFRPGAPRPPKLRLPPVLGSEEPEVRRAYCHRLGLATRLVGYIASVNPTGFPVGLYREWHEARWQVYCDDPASGPGQAVSEALAAAIEDEAVYAAVVAEFSASASYSEMGDLLHFCGEAFIASKAGSAVHVRIHELAEALAVVVSSGSSDPTEMDEHDRMQLERKLEVDFLPQVPAKVAHLRRMHAFFRARLIGLRDDAAAERRAERMGDCRRHMEEHEKLLGCLDASP